MTAVTPELVDAAYAALGSGDPAQVARYWHEDMRWCVPGNHQLAGWYEGRDAFLGFMERVGKLSGGSFSMERVAVLTGGDYSADVTHNVGRRAGATGAASPYDSLDIDVVHVLRWSDGRVVEGRGAIFGDGTTRFNQFWSQLDAGGARISG
ncbi:nuclear transport factor 2 family protein [Planobispora rosea]|nr:nuclear transport factor 2 family protein [Planobispora rosea]